MWRHLLMVVLLSLSVSQLTGFDCLYLNKVKLESNLAMNISGSSDYTYTQVWPTAEPSIRQAALALTDYGVAETGKYLSFLIWRYSNQSMLELDLRVYYANSQINYVSFTVLMTRGSAVGKVELKSHYRNPSFSYYNGYLIKQSLTLYSSSFDLQQPQDYQVGLYLYAMQFNVTSGVQLLLLGNGDPPKIVNRSISIDIFALLGGGSFRWIYLTTIVVYKPGFAPSAVCVCVCRSYRSE